MEDASFNKAVALSSFSVVAAAEVFFQPDIGADKKVTAAHFFDLQFRDAEFSIVPGDWSDFPTIIANDRFEGKFDR